jgi:hypothetical protein
VLFTNLLKKILLYSLLSTLNSQDIADAIGGYNYLQWACTTHTWVAQTLNKLLHGTDQVEKLTDRCLGAFHAISGHLDVQENSSNTIDQRTLQCVEAHLQGVDDDGIHAILNMLQAHPPSTTNRQQLL